MNIKKEKIEEFKKIYNANENDQFGAGINEFFNKWVKLLEEHKGELTGEDIDKYYKEADEEGITGAMFSIAKQMLFNFHENGKEWADKFYEYEEQKYQEFVNSMKKGSC